MSIAQNFPALKPSLNLSFALTKKLDPRISFARASGATYYDGKTVAKAEENLFQFSQEFDNASWATNATRSTISANTTTAPDGTTTADSFLQAAGQTTAGVIGQNIAVSVGDYVYSCFAKPNGKNFIILRETGTDGTNKNTWFDVSTGSVGTTAAGHTATITASTNGFYRCSIKFTPNASRTSAFNIYVADTDNSFTVVDNQQGLYIWGAQLEQRSSVTAYTPTTTQPITNYIPVLQTAAAGVARFDHNPVTGESLGLLIEEQRANLITRSEEFNETAWIKTRATITPNMLIAPDGSLSADKLVEDSTASSTHFIEFQRAGSIGNFALSCYCKASERSIVRVALFSSTMNSHATFDLSTGTASSPNSVLDYSITPVGNGWYRCFISANQPDSRTLQVRILLVDSGTNITYTGDGYSGIYIWGAQLEASTKATSYIKTEASQVTRAIDNPTPLTAETNGTLLVQAPDGSYTTSEKIVGDSIAIPSAKKIYHYPQTLTAGQIAALTS